MILGMNWSCHLAPKSDTDLFFAITDKNLVNDRALVLHKNNKIQHHYQSFGWVGLSKPEAKKKARDIKFMRKIQQKHWMRLGMNANNQKHFRDPTGFIQ